MANRKFDIVIVGAGPGGSATAKIASDLGLKALMLERGKFPGEKNHSGCGIYPSFMRRILPDFPFNMPSDITAYPHTGFQIILLGEEGRSFTISSVSEQAPPHASKCTKAPMAVIVMRDQFDNWFAQQAVKAGAELRCSTLVSDIIKENGVVKGVITETGEEIRAPITIAADGAIGKISRKAGLRPRWPRDVAIFVRHAYEFDADVIPRISKYSGYTLSAGWLPVEEMGFGYTWMTAFGNTIHMAGGGFIQPGGKLGSLISTNPNYIIDRLIQHPIFQGMFALGKCVYYNAHIDPCPVDLGQYPTYTDGLMAVGDSGIGAGALGFGTMIATDSGMYAAQTAMKALEKGDVSAKLLKEYQDKWMKEPWVKDAKTEPYIHAKITSMDGLGPLMSKLPDITMHPFRWQPAEHGQPAKGFTDSIGETILMLGSVVPNMINMLPGIKAAMEGIVKPYTDMLGMLQQGEGK